MTELDGEYQSGYDDGHDDGYENGVCAAAICCEECIKHDQTHTIFVKYIRDKTIENNMRKMTSQSNALTDEVDKILSALDMFVRNF